MQNATTVIEEKLKSREFIGLPALMTLAFNGGDLSPVGDALVSRIKEDARDANALLDLAIIMIMRGDPKLAQAMQALAIQTQPVFHYSRPAMPVKIRALAVLGPGDLMANSPFEFLIENQPVALDLLYITLTQGLPKQIPDHDVLIVAIGESDANQALLAYLDKELALWPRPVINRPAAIGRLSRDITCAQLAPIPGVLMPAAMRVTRAELEECCRPGELARPLSSQLEGVDYPIIIRPIDSHAGTGLARIENLGDLTNYLVNSRSDLFFVSPFIDYRSPDGLFRKYRIILIDGIAYVCHMAISPRWMVHYLNADMLDNEAHRREEADFMASFNSGFAKRHAAALQAIYIRSGLDYVGMDCAETQDGQLLIFEIDSNMVVHDMDSAGIFPYKKIQMPKLFRAFAELLAKRCGKVL